MNYFGQWSNLELLRQDGTTRLAADVLRDVPYVVLLFGASWNRETDEFFPLIEEFYELHHKAKGFEVVYVSRDYNKAEMLRGFLSSERAIKAAERQQRCARTEERRRQHQQHLQEGHPSLPSGTPSKEDTGDPKGKTSNKGEHNIGRDHSTASSSPPPLKRVRELTPGKATNNFSGPLVSLAVDDLTGVHAYGDRQCNSNNISSVRGSGFWAVPYDHVGVVGVPILYHLRVFSYPCVVVCRNKPLDPSVTPQLLPALSTSLNLLENGKDTTSATIAEAAAQTDQVNAPRRRRETPMVAYRVCYPDVVTIAGRFMLESEDPAGENFPWARMSSQVRFAALFFFAIVVAVTAVVLAVVLPTMVTMRQTKWTAAAAAVKTL